MSVSVFLSQLSGTQIGPYQRHTALSSVACLALPYFSTLFNKQHLFGQNFIEHKIYVMIFFYNTETFLTLRRIVRDVNTHTHTQVIK
jgi:hypothetical protein